MPESLIMSFVHPADFFVAGAELIVLLIGGTMIVRRWNDLPLPGLIEVFALLVLADAFAHVCRWLGWAEATAAARWLDAVAACAAAGGLLVTYRRLLNLRGPELLEVEVRKRTAELEEVTARLQLKQHRLRLMLAGTGRGTWEFDPATGQVTWSEGQFQLWGYDPSDRPVTHAEWAARVHPDDLPRCESEIRTAVATGKDGQSEYRIVRPDNCVRWIQTRWAAQVVDGQLLRLVGVNEDISDRKHLEATEAEAREREQFLTALFDGSLLGIQVFDPDGTSVRMNEAHRALLGIPSREYGVGVYNVLTDVTTTPAVAAAFTRAAAGEVVVLNDLPIDFTGADVPWEMNRRKLWVDSTFFPVRDATGRVQAVVAFNQDVTARKRTLDDLADRERRLRLILDHMPVPCMMSDPDFRMTFWNPSAENTFGFSADEVLGRPATDTFVLPDGGTMLEELVTTVRCGREYRGTNPNRTKDGRIIWCRWVNTPLTDATGRLIGVMAMAEDVTALRDAQIALEAEHARFQLLAGAVRDVVTLHEPDGRLRYVSPSCLAITGYTTEEWLGQDGTAPAHPDDVPSVQAALAANARGETATVTWRVRRRDGAYVWLETYSTPVFGSDGTVVSIVASARDVSERKTAEAEREILEQQLRQAQKLEGIGQLAGGVAHDFNNLLTAIGGFADLLAADLPEGPGRHMATEIRRAAGRGAGLTRQLLAFGRKQILKPEVIDPNAVVADLARMLARLLGEDIAFDSRLSPTVPAVRADRGQLEQVLVNLAVNARDAMPTGGTLTIESTELPPDPTAGRDRSFVRISFADTGCGIPADVLPRIFEPFFTTKPVGQGTGLGLATVYGIVTQSGGQVRVQSEIGKGTRFEVDLPAADELPTSRLSGIRRWVGPPTGRTVLVVEDEDAVRTLAAFVLDQAGYRVLTAADGSEALELLARPGDIHLVLTDVVMPGMSGRELAEAVAAQRPGVPVGYLSGYTSDTVVRHGIAEERMAFLPKPFGPDQLTRFARGLLESEPEPAAAG